MLEQLLSQHRQRYPQMQMQDYVKLLFQNEFGGGHMITDEIASLQRLKAENEQRISNEDPLFLSIGNGLCRISLPALPKEISLSTIHRFFITTANTVKGTRASFQHKLEIFTQWCQAGETDAFLEHYQKAGFPAISHSEIYRSCYHPSYRVIKTIYEIYFPLFCKIDQLLSEKQTLILAIDGKSGSGKSSLSYLLTQTYDCNQFHMDDFFLRPEQRTPERFAEIGGNVDYERFYEEVGQKLHAQKPFSYRKYDCCTQTLSDATEVVPKSLTIVEGVYSLHPKLRGLYDYTVFLTIDEAEQQERIRKRNGETMLRRFLKEWIPLENRYFSTLHIAEKCDMHF